MLSSFHANYDNTITRFPDDRGCEMAWSLAAIEFVAWSVLQEDGSGEAVAEEALQEACKANPFVAWNVAHRQVFDEVNLNFKGCAGAAGGWGGAGGGARHHHTRPSWVPSCSCVPVSSNTLSNIAPGIPAQLGISPAGLRGHERNRKNKYSVSPFAFPSPPSSCQHGPHPTGGGARGRDRKASCRVCDGGFLVHGPGRGAVGEPGWGVGLGW